MNTVAARLKALFRNEYFLICMPYVLSYGLMLFNRGLFWEDWLIYNHTPADNISFFRDLGFFLAWPGYMFGLMNASGHFELIGRVLTFFSFLTAALCLNSVLRTVKEMLPADRIAVSALAAVFPYFIFRFALGTLHYSLCYGFFFAGLWALAAYLDGRGRWLRPVSLLLFFIACTTRSFLVFYGLTALYILYREGWDIRRAPFKYADFFVLPVAVFLLNKYLFPPMGEYATENYNSISLKRLLMSPFRVPKTYLENAYYAMKEAVPGFIYWAAGVAAASRALIIGGKMNNETSRRDWVFLALGALAFAAAAFPYIAIRKNPLPGSVDRFQLLLPLGSALTVVYGLKLLKGRHLRFLAGLLIGAFTLYNIRTSLDYQAFWYKKVSIMEGLKDSGNASAGRTFMVTDNTLDMHPIPFEFAFYEYAGFSRKVYGDQVRNFYYKPEDQEGMEIALAFDRERFNIAEYKPGGPQFRLTIDYGTGRPGRMATLGMLRDEYLRPDIFRERVSDMIRVGVEKLPVQAPGARRL